MDDSVKSHPHSFQELLNETINSGFEQLSETLLGSFLATIAASKPNGRMLELGTGSGLSTSWILKGMDADSTLQTIDNDEQLITIAKKYLDHDKRVSFFLGDGEELILNTTPNSLDLIFADTWPGKYNHVEETLALLKQGGIYIVDDMLPQENWPEGYADKASNLINYLESRGDLLITKLSWSTGIIICSKLA